MATHVVAKKPDLDLVMLFCDDLVRRFINHQNVNWWA
jgi:hypothetical protein